MLLSFYTYKHLKASIIKSWRYTIQLLSATMELWIPVWTASALYEDAQKLETSGRMQVEDHKPPPGVKSTCSEYVIHHIEIEIISNNMY